MPKRALVAVSTERHTEAGPTGSWDECEQPACAAAGAVIGDSA